jgi:hypothetical protein
VGYNGSTVEEQVAIKSGLFCFAEDHKRRHAGKGNPACLLLWSSASPLKKGVSTMSRKRSFVTLSEEQTLAWYQHLVQAQHGYTLALALKAGLSPEEAARLWENRHGSRTSQPSQATIEIVERQAEQIAEVFALTYGEKYVQIEQQDETWLVEVTIADREPLECYGASLDLYTQWVAEQVRLVCEPKGIRCSVWLDQETPSPHLSLQVSR